MASECGECEIGVGVLKWLNVGMSEKPSAKSIYIATTRNSSFAVNRLFKDLAKVVHSERLRVTLMVV
jgi:hypothetical protein